MTDNLVLIGGGGHCRACIDVIECEDKFQIAGIVDKKENVGKDVLGYRIIASDDDMEALAEEYGNFLVTVGQTDTPDTRKRLYEHVRDIGGNLPVIISPRAHVSRHAVVGDGTIVMHQASVGANVRVGANCIINAGSVIEHDSVVGDFSHISTASVVNGECCVGGGTFIGSNSVISHGVSVTSGVVLGAGSVVVRSIEEGGRYAGAPARRLDQ